ncbi:MAG: DEAD/DEAH box helicase [Flavobacteriales bacterium]
MTFKELGLDDTLIKAVETLGFEIPSPIQEKSIPVLLEGNRDYIGLAQTGTGKTAAFGLPLLQHIDVEYRAIQGLILCPTRELCLQITKELKSYAKYKEGVNIVAVYGGANISEQIRDIKKGANIIVGTPGRTIDLMGRKVLKFDTVSTVILDEADEMLNMGFKEDINEILEGTPPFKHTWLFSATMPREVERIAQTYMENPHTVTVGTKNSSAANIEHQYCLVSGRDQYHALRRFIDFSPGMFGIVFCRTRRDAKEFAEKLMTDGYNADALHGDLSQAQRDSVMNKFRNRALQVLIATDVAARGIDVDDVTHVFHVDLPDEIESYTHRAGRTARAGKSGISIALVSPSKAGRVRLVEKQIGKKMDLVKAPTGNDICGQQIIQLIQNVHDVQINEKGIAPYLAKINEELSTFSKEELIQRFVSVEFNRFLKAYEKAGDINLEPRGSRRGEDRDDRRGEKGDRMSGGTQNSKRIFINVGKLDGFENKGQILGFICNQSGIDGNSVGKIDLFDSFAFLGVEDGVGEKLISTLNGKNIENREIRVEFSQDKPREPRSEYRGKPRGNGDRDRSRSDKPRSDRDRGAKKSFSSSNSGGANARNFRSRRPR